MIGVCPGWPFWSVGQLYSIFRAMDGRPNTLSKYTFSRILKLPNGRTTRGRKNTKKRTVLKRQMSFFYLPPLVSGSKISFRAHYVLETVLNTDKNHFANILIWLKGQFFIIPLDFNWNKAIINAKANVMGRPGSMLTTQFTENSVLSSTDNADLVITCLCCFIHFKDFLCF